MPIASLNKLHHKIGTFLADTFWVVPGLMVAAGIAAAFGLVAADRQGAVPDAWLGTWLYDGGSTGARTLLGAVASSTIGVAGTVFSITIAALSLAAGQMGPRLLRNFTHDRGNQLTLGAFLGTFAYALIVLRSVRSGDEGIFVPHLALTVAIALALACVATLVYFVGHMASRINVDTVIELVGEDLHAAVRRLTTKAPQAAPEQTGFWQGAEPVRDARRGYLQQVDADRLADWAAAQGTAIRLLVRPGDYVFPGAPIAVVQPSREGAGAAIAAATALGRERSSSADLEFAIRQLVEVADRALSAGINDPYTAISVLDRLGASLCDLAGCELPTGVVQREGRTVLEVPVVSYDGLVDAMFHMLRQDGAGCTAVLIRILDVMGAVASCERRPARLETLRRHVRLVVEDARRSIPNRADLGDLRRRESRFLQAADGAARASWPASSTSIAPGTPPCIPSARS